MITSHSDYCSWPILVGQSFFPICSSLPSLVHPPLAEGIKKQAQTSVCFLGFVGGTLVSQFLLVVPNVSLLLGSSHFSLFICLG